jgi:hypothetical protein
MRVREGDILRQRRLDELAQLRWIMFVPCSEQGGEASGQG